MGVAHNQDIPEADFRTDPWAEYAILTWEGRQPSLEFRRAHYDAEELIHIIETSGRPHAGRMIMNYRRPL